MDFSWVTPTLVVALLALWIAFFNYRRNNHVVVQILHCESASTHGIRDRYQLFRVLLRNLGIPLHDISMHLSFTGPDGSGDATTPLHARDGTRIIAGQFAKGMMAEFEFRTDRMDDREPDFLEMLRDLRTQSARLDLAAGGYRATSFKLHSWTLPLKARWNWFAHRLEDRLSYTVQREPPLPPLIRHRLTLPRFELPGYRLLYFIRNLRIDPLSGQLLSDRPAQS